MVRGAIGISIAACAQTGGSSDVRHDSGSTAGTSVPVEPPAAWTVTETGWGPIRTGMTVAEARAALGGDLPEPTNRECDHIRPPRGPTGVLLMVIGGKIVRVEVSDTTVRAATGVRVGDTEAQVKAAYPGRVEVTPHKYVHPDGHYLAVRRRVGADSAYGLVFETDGRRVTRFRGGRFPEVQWVEGCS